VDPKKLAARINSRKEYKERRQKKEAEGNMTRTAALFGTQAMAEDVGLSLEEYRKEIIKACYLDFDDPIAERKKTFIQMENIKKTLDDLKIQYVHVESEDADIKIKI
jgi:aminopeptidase